MQTLQVELPDELLASSEDIDVEALARLTEARAREALMVKLYDLGRLSTGQAATLLGVSRRAFLGILSRHGVSEYDKDLDLEEEVRVALSSREEIGI
ncbi:MAG TPA: UPF0175 family protein [Herpetosiphonaceae bacterium]|nr:UPF0175 family protein [Herpetosiphonaceae bacterium]